MQDEIFFSEHKVIPGTSNPAVSKKFVGGVVANISRHLALLGVPVQLVSALGNDADSQWIQSVLAADGVNTRHVVHADAHCGRYTSFLQPDGTLFAAMCHDISRETITTHLLSRMQESLMQARLLVCDANLHESVIAWLVDFAHQYKKELVIEPVSVPRATALSKMPLQGVMMMTPNRDELPALAGQQADEAVLASRLMERGLQKVWVRKGPEGSTLYTKNETLHLDAIPVQVLDTTGAGDAALAGYLYAYLQGKDELNCLRYGHSLAYAVIGCEGPVYKNLNEQVFHELINTYYPAHA